MIKDYLLFSVKSLKNRKLRSWLTMIGIFIGIAAVVSLISLGEGLRTAISSQFSMLGPDIISVQAGGVTFGPPGTGVVNPLEKDQAIKIEKINGVEFAIPRLIKSGKAEFNDIASFGVAGSIPDGEQRKIIENMLGLSAEKGRLLKDGDRNKVVVGNNFKDDKIFQKPVKVGDTILVEGKEFDVIGIADKLGSFILDNALMINEGALRDLYNEKDEVSVIAVKVANNADIIKVKDNIEKLMRKERNVDEGEEDFSVQLAVDVLETLDSTLFAVQLFVYIIASISIVVGGIGIMNTMYTAVIERTKDIGIMKSIGARNKDIFYLFFFESGLLGLVGGLVGIIFGATAAKLLAFAGSLALGSDLIQANISIFIILGALFFSFVIGTVAGIIPAIRASKLNPVDALRYAK